MSLLLLEGCGTLAVGKQDDNRVAWNGSRAYTKMIKGFAIKPAGASRIAWRGRKILERPISRESAFIVGQWYWFGRETKIDAPLEGYYVNGDSGKLEYRESDKMIKSGGRKLPKEPWSKITPLPETGSNK
jgi:hypothetical protein